MTGPPPGRPPRGAANLAKRRARGLGFTLIELLVVVAIIAVATAGVGLAMRDAGSAQLEREAQRLAALLESARTHSRTTGLPATWVPTQDGFRFDGLPPKQTPPSNWLYPGTEVRGSITLVLGPEPIIGPQGVTVVAADQPGRSLRVSTDGLRPFSVSAE